MTLTVKDDNLDIVEDGIHQVRSVDYIVECGVVFLKDAAFLKTEEDATEFLEEGDHIYLEDEMLERCRKL